jgi:hypothetical protein
MPQTNPIVFIASSTEGLEIAKVVRLLLLQDLGQDAEVKSWTREFELSATYIESLEKPVKESDFAVLVLTPDDVTRSRGKKKLAPRDNVIFELGLFFGQLGRERCYLVQEDRPNLKLPSDLLGVKSATFKRRENVNLETALATACALIVKRITKLSTRYKLSPGALAVQNAIRSFCGHIEGEWWERIARYEDDRGVISFFKIEQDHLANSVFLSGKTYDREGIHVANWKSLIARVEMDENKVLYTWKGWHPTPNSAHIPFHGFGELEFDKSLESNGKINRGGGKFWTVNEAHPECTIVKPVECRRILEKRTVDTMTTGTRNNVKLLVEKTLSEW